MIVTLLILEPWITGETEDVDEDIDCKDGIKKDGVITTVNDKDSMSSGNCSAERKDGQCNSSKSDRDHKDSQRSKDLKMAETEIVRDLKAQLK